MEKPETEEEYTPWNPRINPEGIKLETVLDLDGKVAKLILNGDKHTPDGREFPMIALINIVREPELTLITRSSMGSVSKYTGEKLDRLLNHLLYSIEEITPTSDMKFPEVKED